MAVAAWCAPVHGTFEHRYGNTFHAAPANGPAALIDLQGMTLHATKGRPWQGSILVLGTGREHGPTVAWNPRGTFLQGQELFFTGDRFSVQYQVTRAGVRQNFIVPERPAGAGRFLVELGLQGDLVPDQVGPGSISFRHNGEEVFLYTGLMCWDATGRSLPARLTLRSAARLVIEVDDREAVYPIVVDPVSTTANSLLLAPLAGSEFGISSCTAGDLNGDGYSDLVVGAWLGSQGQNNEGLAYVYYGSASGIPTTASLLLQVDQVGAQFGCSVSTAGDVNGDGYSDLLVGARTWESSSAELSEGAVFVYYGSASGISTVANLRIESNHAGDNFGSNVATAGDLNNDGYSDVLIGAYLAEYPTYQEGAVWVHLGSATGLNPIAQHKLERNISAAHFGRSLACAGDVNGDGYSDIVIGAPDAPNVNADAGQAFVWHGTATGLGAGVNPAPSLTLLGSTVPNGSFGWSVSTAGDVNGDGYSDVVVGAYLDNNGGQVAEGTARVFMGSATGLNAASPVLLEGVVAGVWFGRSVGTAGDVNGDGYGDVMVGASLFSNGQSQEGVVKLFLGSAAGITGTAALQWELNSAGANLGESINPAGDVNGDGFTDVVLGARIYGSGGAAAVFHGGTLGASTTSSLIRFGPAANALLGTAVASAGDVNGDGYSDALFGAPGAGTGGQVHLHYGSVSGISATPSLTLQNGMAGSSYGASVASAGDVNGDGYADVVIGAPTLGNGTAYLYMGGPSGLSTTPALTLAPGSLQFGAAVSAAGDLNADGFGDVVIGAPGSGHALIYVGAATGLASTPLLTLSEPPTSNLYGCAVSTAGDVNGDGYSDLVVGARLGSNGQANEGLVFVYHGSHSGVSTPYARKLEANVANADFGVSVASAGDINGDGYSDLVVGADLWESTSAEADEGAAFIFNGSASGTSATITTTLQRNIAGAAMGRRVAEGGDVNGDGYADVLVGSPLADFGQVDEGLVYVFRGSALGTSTGVVDLLQADVTLYQLGAGVAGGGDLDGDGYSDVIAGAPQAAPTFSAQGAAYWFRGNSALSLERLTRAYDADLITPMSTNSMDFLNTAFFGVGHHARNPVHRCRARLRWEVVFQGQPFTGSPITNGVLSTGTATNWTTLPTSGVELKQLITKAPNHLRYKWRVRVEYDMAKLIHGQRFSRWFYGYASGVGDIGVLPIELSTFTAWPEGTATVLEWTTASESNSAYFSVERSTDGLTFAPLGRVDASGSSSSVLGYTFTDLDAPLGTAYYRLDLVDQDGSGRLSPLVSVHHHAIGGLFPNPSDGPVHLQLERGIGAARADVLDAMGRFVRSIAMPMEATTFTIEAGTLSPGRYTLQLRSADGRVIDRAPFVVR